MINSIISAAFFGMLLNTVAAYPGGASIYGRARPNSASLAGVEQPQSGLAAPDGMKLQYLTIGLGTQNYTCNSSAKSTDKPASGGAKAKLYDLGPLVSSPASGSMIDGLLPVLPAMALEFARGSKKLPVQMQSMGIPAAPIGKHFFDSTMVPIFDLRAVKASLSAAKSGSVPAPATACPGLEGEGAVDWLFLTDNGKSTGGLKAGYRLETAGGSPPATCEGIGGDGQSGHVEVPYAAEYWFYVAA